MARTKKFSEVESFFIVNNLTKSVEEIANSLNTSSQSVQKFIDSLDEDTKNSLTAQPKTNVIENDVKGDKQFRRSIISDKEKGVVVLTQAAAAYMDDHTEVNRKNSSHIHRPFGDDR